MLSFKVNPVYTNLGILLKLRKDVPEIEFSIQVLNETGKFRSDFTKYSIKNGIWKFHVAMECWKRSEYFVFIHLESRCVFFIIIIIVKPIAFLTFLLPSMS